jgi:predicted transcriptional regulator
MKNKNCTFRFDEKFIDSLARLASLESTNKTGIIRRAVLDYWDVNIGRLEERHEKMNFCSSSED